MNGFALADPDPRELRAVDDACGASSVELGGRLSDEHAARLSATTTTTIELVANWIRPRDRIAHRPAHGDLIQTKPRSTASLR